MGLWPLAAGTTIGLVVCLALYLLCAHAGLSTSLRRALRRRTTWAVMAPAVAFGMVVGVPYAYIRSIRTNAPPPLTFADLGAPSTTAPAAPAAAPETQTTEAPGAAAPTVGVVPAVATTAPPSAEAAAVEPTANEVEGAWAVGSGTQARYNIDDTVMGQTAQVVGSTSDVTGTMEIVGTTVTAANVTVNMQTVTCNCVHDQKYHEMLETDIYPTSNFALTVPIELGAIPAEGEIIEVPVTGNFTIHGVTREVTFTLAALRQDGRIAINGRIPVRLEDYDIENPDAGPFGGLSNCAIDLLVAFDRAA